MRFVRLTCPVCGGAMESDLDNFATYCPYCGQKLMIDIEQFGEVLKEKEHTKQVSNIEQSKTRRTWIKENRKLEEKRVVLKNL